MSEKALDPNKMDDPEKIRALMINADRKGRSDISWACKVRLAELAGRSYDDNLEREFWIAVHVAEEIKTQENGKTTRLSRTRQKYQRDGALKCIADLATKPGTTEGFHILADNGRVDLTFEAVLLRHHGRFQAESMEIARNKLLDHGVDEAKVLGWINGET